MREAGVGDIAVAELKVFDVRELPHERQDRVGPVSGSPPARREVHRDHVRHVVDSKAAGQPFRHPVLAVRARDVGIVVAPLPVVPHGSSCLLDGGHGLLLTPDAAHVPAEHHRQDQDERHQTPHAHQEAQQRATETNERLMADEAAPDTSSA
jgi:hypothetical protein